LERRRREKELKTQRTSKRPPPTDITSRHAQEHEWCLQLESDARSGGQLRQRTADVSRGVKLGAQLENRLSVPDMSLVPGDDACQPPIAPVLDDRVTELTVHGKGADAP
jgi:hypothetical protein